MPGFNRVVAPTLTPIARTLLATAGILVSIALQPRALAQPTWYNCRTREVFTPEKRAWCDRWQRLQNSTLAVPPRPGADPALTPVTLENGRYRQDDGSLMVELVNEPGWMAFGDLNGDRKDDAALIVGVALDANNRTVSTYLTAVMDIDGDAEALAPLRLGERILLNGPIAISDNRITIPFLTQTEAFDRHYRVYNTTLVESH